MLPEIPKHLGIGERAVPIADDNAVAANEGIQTMAVVLGKQFA